MATVPMTWTTIRGSEGFPEFERPVHALVDHPTDGPFVERFVLREGDIYDWISEEGLLPQSYTVISWRYAEPSEEEDRVLRIPDHVPPISQEKVRMEPNGDHCPWCGKKLLTPWSGVKCPDETGCGYWYCV